ncbi:hypothetical protein ANN_12102 [Periplaneta americana]|uniref:HPS5-like beta-propeller domain-containing protein n=1 Tax=Periplaneta americana TaxID=6978 RepID=A0ABQ8T823_PERAM|nr:hypothetical protein ANN_12102 [Periplaneta americana]
MSPGSSTESYPAFAHIGLRENPGKNLNQASDCRDAVNRENTMADPSLEEDGILREWAPLTHLLQQIPLKAQRGLFTHDLNLTCVDTLPEFIAVGTNLGLVYWYNRKKGDLQRLRCENTGSAITCVKVISTVDFMVAAGNDQGIVTVFQIPKIPPDSLPESMKPKKNKQVERYTISGLHSSSVTAIEWSMNGMKLFSGDRNGIVVLTEIDFYMHLSKSVELLNEKYEIVQLSYSQQLLLVSTLYRSIVCCHREDRWKVAQVGQKERKTLGRLGATFCLGSGRPQELVVYASRPGLRVWLADKNGVVQQTLIYKDALMSEHTHTPLINPAPYHVKQSHGDHQFGPLLVFRENLLVTYSSDIVYVLNPATITVVATVADLRKVQDVAVNKDEIFILEGERSLIRVAYTPETTATLVQGCLLSKNLKVRIYKTVTLPVVLYGCETWTLTLREEHSLRVFENKVLRKIFGAKRDEVTEEWTKLNNTELHALYSSPDIIRNIKSRRLRWAGHVARMGESRNAYRVLVGRPEGKRPLGRPRRRWEDNIRMDLREVGYDDRDWINLAQDRDQWRAYVRAAMNLRIP